MISGQLIFIELNICVCSLNIELLTADMSMFLGILNEPIN